MPYLTASVPVIVRACTGVAFVRHDGVLELGSIIPQIKFPNNYRPFRSIEELLE
jgi:hypothetical protein